MGPDSPSVATTLLPEAERDTDDDRRVEPAEVRTGWHLGFIASSARRAASFRESRFLYLSAGVPTARIAPAMEAGYDHGPVRLRQVEDRVRKTPNSGSPDFAANSGILPWRPLDRGKRRPRRVQEVTAQALSLQLIPVEGFLNLLLRHGAKN